MASQQPKKKLTNQNQNPNESQAITFQHQVSPVNQMSLPVTCSSQLTQIQKMTPIHIPHPVMTQSTTSKTSTLSTATSRTLRPRAPINYSETPLK